MKFLEYVLGEKGWLWVGGFKGERDTTQKCVETFEEGIVKILVVKTPCIFLR